MEIGDGATGEIGWRKGELIADVGERKELVTVPDPTLVLIVNGGEIVARRTLDG